MKENEKEVKSNFDPSKYAKGTLTLEKPIQDGENTITELKWDFSNITGTEYCDAMDMDPNGSNVFRLTTKQALYLFATAAGKATPGLDAKDIRTRIGMMDANAAIQATIVFFNTSSRAGNGHLSFD